MKNSRRISLFDISLFIIISITVFVTFYPFWNLLVISFNDPQDSMRGGLTFWPRIFSTVSYEKIFASDSTILTALSTSVTRTLLGTVINVAITAWLAYMISLKKFILRGFLSKYLIATMYVSAGIIPVYLLYSRMGLLNTFWVYILPHFVSAYNIILVHTYIRGLPASLTEAAEIDGAGDVRVFFNIILPLIVPVLATVTLFIAVWQWSQWQDTYFFASRNKKLTTLQYEMMQIVKQSTGKMTEQQTRDVMARGQVTGQSMQASMVIVATVPILMVYPFIQKYFVKGMTLGSVKE